MSQAQLIAEIEFANVVPAAGVMSPSQAIGEIIGLTTRLGPKVVELDVFIHGDSVKLDLMVEFVNGAGDPVDALKLALVKSESEADFNVHFPAGLNAARDNWIAANIDIDNPALPSGKHFGLPLPLINAFASTARQVRRAGSPFGFAIRLTRDPGSTEQAKALAPAFVQAEQQYGRVPALSHAIREAIDVVRSSGWRSREAFCLARDADGASTRLVEASLRDCAVSLYQFVPADVCTIAWSPLAAMGHAAGHGDTLQAAVGPRRREAYLTEVMTLVLNEAADLRRGGPGTPRTPKPGPRPVAPAPTQPFVFLSYAHREAENALALVSVLRASGCRVWYDEGIEAGQVWDECLEDRIRHSSLFLACVSPVYEASRYCRREIKFADLVGRQIVPVSFAPHVWGTGLVLMFQELQIRHCRQEVERQRLTQQIQILAPAVFGA